MTPAIISSGEPPTSRALALPCEAPAETAFEAAFAAQIGGDGPSTAADAPEPQAGDESPAAQGAPSAALTAPAPAPLASPSAAGGAGAPDRVTAPERDASPAGDQPLELAAGIALASCAATTSLPSSTGLAPQPMAGDRGSIGPPPRAPVADTPAAAGSAPVEAAGGDAPAGAVAGGPPRAVAAAFGERNSGHPGVTPEPSPGAELLGGGGSLVTAMRTEVTLPVSGAPVAPAALPAALQLALEGLASGAGAAGPRGGRLTLRLDPPELGELSIDVRVRGGEVYLRIEAQAPAVADVLGLDLDALKRSLAQHGLTLAGFEVSTGHRGPWADDSPDAGEAGDAASAPSAAARARPPPGPRIDGALDVVA